MKYQKPSSTLGYLIGGRLEYWVHNIPPYIKTKAIVEDIVSRFKFDRNSYGDYVYRGLNISIYYSPTEMSISSAFARGPSPNRKPDRRKQTLKKGKDHTAEQEEKQVHPPHGVIYEIARYVDSEYFDKTDNYKEELDNYREMFGFDVTKYK